MSSISRIVDAMPATEGAGVRVYRALGTPALRSLDPFLMLDYFGSDKPGEYIAGFPDHPHRGFITITYMLDGRMRHRDSMGNEGVLSPGGVQWMKAASGVIHSEMPEQQDGLMRGFQLWLNLPAAQKMSDPAYRDIDADDIPAVDAPWGQARVLAGQFDGRGGPIVDDFTGLFYVDLRLVADGRVRVPALRDRNAFAFVFEGAAVIADKRIEARQLAVVEADAPEISAGSQGAALIVVAGKPLNEPVAQRGPFVMNS